MPVRQILLYYLSLPAESAALWKFRSKLLNCDIYIMVQFHAKKIKFWKTNCKSYQMNAFWNNSSVAFPEHILTNVEYLNGIYLYTLKDNQTPIPQLPQLYLYFYLLFSDLPLQSRYEWCIVKYDCQHSHNIHTEKLIHVYYFSTGPSSDTLS